MGLYPPLAILHSLQVHGPPLFLSSTWPFCDFFVQILDTTGNAMSGGPTMSKMEYVKIILFTRCLKLVFSFTRFLWQPLRNRTGEGSTDEPHDVIEADASTKASHERSKNAAGAARA